MAPTTPPLDFIHEKGFEIPTKHKEAIRQLHCFTKISVPALQIRYGLRESIIRHILEYNILERARPMRTGRPQLLINQ
jgi:hypothetical protein